MESSRGKWSSKAGFIIAASGSAVGLGNIWKYPYIAGENGGAAFTFVYLICIAVVGLPILLSEFVIGRKTQLSPVGAFEKLVPKTKWKFIGYLGVASAFVILSFYGVIGGWTIKYTYLAISTGFENLSGNPEAAGEVFNAFTTSTWNPLFWHLIFMSLTVWIIVNGIKGGIEKWSKIMMPMIVIILILLVVRGLTLPGGMKGVEFLFSPKFSELTPQSIVLALGHSFFTISLGMGTMITYGSYLGREQNLLKSGVIVIGVDTAIALLAGIAIFTAVFALGADPAGGPGLIFTVLPTIFPKIPGGHMWASLFFFVLFMAALTSAISMLEVVTAYFVDQKGWSRSKATLIFGGVITVVGGFSSLSLGGFSDITIFGMNFFAFLDGVSSKYMLPIGGLLIAVFIVYRWGLPKFLDEIMEGHTGHRPSAMVVKVIFIIAAAVVFFIIVNEIVQAITGSSIIG